MKFKEYLNEDVKDYKTLRNMVAVVSHKKATLRLCYHYVLVKLIMSKQVKGSRFQVQG